MDCTNQIINKQLQQIPENLKVNPSLQVSQTIKQQYQCQYPRGNRNQVVNQMTKISNKAMAQYNRCKNWKEVFQFHKRNTPWLGDIQINQIIKFYKMEAQTFKDQGKLRIEDQWRLQEF